MPRYLRMEAHLRWGEINYDFLSGEGEIGCRKSALISVSSALLGQKSFLPLNIMPGGL